VTPDVLTTQQAVDPVFILIFGVSVVMLLGITAAMIYFIIRYHHSRQPVPASDKDKNLVLEIVWTVIPSIIVMVMFYYGWAGYLTLRNVPPGAMQVKVTARQWSWSFEYPNGRISDKLFVPTNKPVKVVLTSKDVLHSFYVPAFRVKRDAVPGMENYLWFEAKNEGSYDIFCAEYCGAGHADMLSTVEALPPEKFDAWYAKGGEEQGEEGRVRGLLAKHGCVGCHSLDGTKMVGPTFKDLAGRQVEVVSNGKERTLKADAEYIRRSILDPGADVVEGFPPVMPSFKGQIPDDELEEIVAFLAGTVKKEAAEHGEEESAGEKLAMENGCFGCHSTDGSRKVGPTFKGLYGSQVAITRGGKKLTVTADKEYLTRSIREPKADIVEGYPPVMPSFSQLSEEQLEALLEYLESLR
jgi:cytochrome c oxidase subunit II